MLICLSACLCVRCHALQLRTTRVSTFALTLFEFRQLEPRVSALDEDLDLEMDMANLSDADASSDSDLDVPPPQKVCACWGLGFRVFVSVHVRPRI